jgi:glutathione S-transferase
VEARLFTIPASHPGIAAALMLDHKGIAYKRTDLMPVISKVVLRGLGFPRQTVPALKIDGDKIQGSRSIARELERLRPEPALFPADPAKRAAVEEAERFGDERLQHPIRQLLWWTIKRDKSSLRSYSEGAKLGVPIGLAVATGGPIVALSARFNEANDETARSAINALPGMLDKVDAWIADGTLNGPELNVADFQIAPSIGLALTLDDLRPAIEGRPAAALAKRVVPDYPGHTPPILPRAWLEPLRASEPAN